jgi:hypothetical protein
VLLDGQGGEPLFTATPVAVLDLLKRGHLSTAYRAIRGFDRWWFEPYGITLKWMVRALAPPYVMRARERTRSHPPWLPGMPGRTLQPQYRSARDYVVRSLVGLDPNIEFNERVMQTVGAEYASPLLDMRVIRQSMEIPIEFKVPAVQPKPVLADAFLGNWASSRMKAPQTGYFVALAESMRRDFAAWLQPGNLSSRKGYVDSDGLTEIGEAEWLGQCLRLIPVEAWLRREEIENGD